MMLDGERGRGYKVRDWRGERAHSRHRDTGVTTPDVEVRVITVVAAARQARACQQEFRLHLQIPVGRCTTTGSEITSGAAV
jgi:hypothetical protein